MVKKKREVRVGHPAEYDHFHLTRLILNNFRCYERLILKLHPQLTVLVAENGGGKTTLLDAIRIGLWPYISSFDLAKSKYADPHNNIGVDDVSVLEVGGSMARQIPASVTLAGNYGNGTYQEWRRYRDSEAPGTHTKDDPGVRTLKDYATALQAKIRHIEQDIIDLPVIGYYGTGRLYDKKRLTKNKDLEGQAEIINRGIRTFAYLDCLDPASNYKQFEVWYTSVFLKVRENQVRQLEQKGVPEVAPEILSPIRVVQTAVDILLRSTGWHTLEYSETYDKSLVLYHDQQGILKVDQLSDGIKNMLAMVGDIAYRCALLNSHLGAEAAQQSQGIVMIDEVDMHLHPKWQQTVLRSLLEAFPNIQFIVTTHSPQVLSTVRREHIRLLGINKGGKAVAEEPLSASYGEPSNDVLQAIMQVDPQPPIPEKGQLERLTELVDQSLYDSEEARSLMASLQQALNPHHPQLEKIERSIRRQKALGR